ncbi:unannotated protein [freshwater metagenome]|uniref:Unannotated protein n=1 Tax=freshwater metagenome TaxID=449393 RepID=A0A6J7D5Y9_9ZZZZ|nr:DUF3071 domain-containing protein [Actinomycetota bacterium]
MTELRLTGKTPDGLHLALTNSEGEEFTVRISDTLRANVNQPRLSAVNSDDQSEEMSVKEIQRRLRSGESMEAIAREGNISVDKVKRFAGPILQERLFIINMVHEISLRKESAREESEFLQVIEAKLAARGVNIDELAWQTWRAIDGTWTIELAFPNRDGSGKAQWSFDQSKRTIAALDDNGRWLLGEDAPVRRVEPGIIHSDATHPSRIVENIQATPVLTEEPVRETPRLVAIRETPAAADTEDGIVARAKVPSWDEIMFGRSASDEERDDEN